MRFLRRRSEICKTVIALSDTEFVETGRVCPRNFSKYSSAVVSKNLEEHKYSRFLKIFDAEIYFVLNSIYNYNKYL